MVLIGVDLHLSAVAPVSVEILARTGPGGRHATSPQGWERLLEAPEVPAKGKGQLTRVPGGIALQVPGGGGVVSLAVFVSGAAQLYSVARDGEEVWADDTVVVRAGPGLADRWDGMQGGRAFGGRLHYTKRHAAAV